MSRRLKIQTGSSPLRISLGTVDASGALFDQVLFDANQAPLRLFTRGFADIPVIQKAAGGSVIDVTVFNYVYASARPPTPAGTHPLFMSMWMCPKDIVADVTYFGPRHYVSPGYRFKSWASAGLGSSESGSGGGAVMGTDGLYALNFCWSQGGNTGVNRIFYAIFRNYL